MKHLEWYLARRHLASRRGGRLLSFITWIALGGVTVGVTALVVVIGVMTGAQEDLRNAILSSTPHVTVLQQGSSLRMDDWRAVVDSVRAVPGVTAAAPFILGSVNVERGGYSQPGNLFGVLADTTGAPPTEMESNIARGVYDLAPTESGLPPILLGSGLASRGQVFPGDTVLVFTIENMRLNSFGGMLPTTREFEVTGTFTTGMWDYDMKNLYTTLEAAQDFLGLDPSVASGVGAQIEDPGQAETVGDRIGDRLGFPYHVSNWMQDNKALFSALKLEKMAMGIILFLIVVVAAFNIISTLVMVVADRTREIGILKSMGMTRGAILRVFMLQGAWIGVVGTVVGTTLGVVICWLVDTFDIIPIPPEVYFMDSLPVALRFWDVTLIVAASVAVAFAATIYPSLQASRLEPVEAIRHD